MTNKTSAAELRRQPGPVLKRALLKIVCSDLATYFFTKENFVIALFVAVAFVTRIVPMALVIFGALYIFILTFIPLVAYLIADLERYVKSVKSRAAQ